MTLRVLANVLAPALTHSVLYKATWVRALPPTTQEMFAGWVRGRRVEGGTEVKPSFRWAVNPTLLPSPTPVPSQLRGCQQEGRGKEGGGSHHQWAALVLLWPWSWWLLLTLWSCYSFGTKWHSCSLGSPKGVACLQWEAATSFWFQTKPRQVDLGWKQVLLLWGLCDTCWIPEILFKEAGREWLHVWLWVSSFTNCQLSWPELDKRGGSEAPWFRRTD